MDQILMEDLNFTTSIGGEKTTKEQHDNYLEALDKYFELKQKYDNNLLKISKKNSEKEKGQSYLKAKCIQCKKEGGTIFSNKGNRYSAVCGASKPCGLRIDLYRGFFTNIQTTLYELKSIVESSKDCMISLKNDEIFKYKGDTECVEHFKSLGSHFSTAEKMYLELLKTVENTYNNKEKVEKIAELHEKSNDLIKELQKGAQEYMKSSPKQFDFIQSLVEQQIRLLFPIFKEIDELKYEVREMEISVLERKQEYNDDSGKKIIERRDFPISVLVQRPVELEKEEINTGEPRA